MIGDKKEKKGFSLLEVVVGVGIFMFLLVVIFDIFQHSIMTQRNSIAVQEMQEGIRYSLELMSKELRSAKANINDFGVQCQYEGHDLWNMPAPDLDHLGNRVYNLDESDNVLYFRNRNGECVYYFVEDKRLKIERGGLELFITPKDLEINNFSVLVDDNNVEELIVKQPNVTLLFEVSSNMDGFSSLRLQTSISSRNYQ